MIRLKKAPKPDILEANSDIWTNEYVELKAQGGKDAAIESRYRHKQIKDALILETNAKCAYCESKIIGTDFGDVEHVKPKRLYPELFVDWDNLTLSCAKCNIYKGDTDGILDPYKDEIEEHLKFLGPMITISSHSMLGSLTIRQLRLNRDGLIMRRAKSLSELQNQIDLLHSLQANPLKVAIEHEIIQTAESNSEFSAFARQYIKDMGLGYLFDDN